LPDYWASLLANTNGDTENITEKLGDHSLLHGQALDNLDLPEQNAHKQKRRSVERRF
jgi:hypothetical protein